MNRPEGNRQIGISISSGKAGESIIATRISSRLFIRSFYIVFGAPERWKSRDGFDSSVPVSMECALPENERMSARPFRLSACIVERTAGRSQWEREEI